MAAETSSYSTITHHFRQNMLKELKWSNVNEQLYIYSEIILTIKKLAKLAKYP